MLRLLSALTMMVSGTVAIDLSAGADARTGRVHDTAQRPVVIVLHGRGEAASDSASFRRDVLAWLREGAQELTGDYIIESDDVRLVWYSDLLAAERPRVECVRSGGTAATTSGEASTFSALVMLAGSLLDAAAGDSSLGDPMMRSLAGELRFFADPLTRCAAEQRVNAALERAHRDKRPVVMVAYSFGGLVAWSHLQQRAAAGQGATSAPEIYRLVTVGSPVASSSVRQLVFNDSRATPGLPVGVRGWVNIVDRNDPFAAPLFESARADTARSGTQTSPDSHIAEVAIDGRTGDPHDLRGYLRDPATTRAVVGAWCEAGGSAYARCSPLLGKR